ncbi:MAG: 4Fe-4S dicluster domain-containing protein [Acidobacteria bacterium]|nr:4Fe-4S dicluster domain-containing protein [Acidobacteriota bacterium]
MPKFGWLLDAKRCIECRACESACKQWNNLDTGVQMRRVRTFETGTFPQVRTKALSLACNHCDDPACISVCPVKALSRVEATGAVVQDHAACIGCQQCVRVCPYSAPVYDTKTRKVFKCTMCVDRTAEGLLPACATLCPTGALKYLPWEEILASGASESTENFPSSATKPRIRFVGELWS